MDPILRVNWRSAFITAWFSSILLLVNAGDFRRRYIDALQAADAGDLEPLLAFARS